LTQEYTDITLTYEVHGTYKNVKVLITWERQASSVERRELIIH